MSNPNKPLEVHDLTVSYQRKPVLYGIDLEIEAGSLVGVIGPNGAGKSTLVKAIMNMVKPNGGYVKIFGQSPKEGISRIGYIPQRESVDWDFPVTVMDVVLMGRTRSEILGMGFAFRSIVTWAPLTILGS